MAFSFLCLSYRFYDKWDKLEIILGGLLVYQSAYSFGFGSSSWLYISELFPLRIRSREYALSIAIDRLFSACLTFIFPYIIEISYLVTFTFFAGFCVFSLVFVYFIPETKGKGLHEVSKEFDVDFVIPDEPEEQKSLNISAHQVW
jgi:hypothetical protein